MTKSKRFSRIISFALAMMIVSALTVPAFAAEEPRVVPSQILATYEDVFTVDAVTDFTFNAILAEIQQYTAMPRGATWNCWGEQSWGTADSGAYLAKPIGYTHQIRDDGVIMPTYHYTNTYVSLLGSQRGSSGRIWGSGTVKAVGTYCDNDVWALGVHEVKYGISN